MPTAKNPPQNPADTSAESELKKLQDDVTKWGQRAKRLQEEKQAEEELQTLREKFEGLVKQASSTAQQLNNFEVNPGLRRIAHPDTESGEWLASLSFCGFLEGDFAERSYLEMPILLSGGFFLRTHYANILFDPGMGTLVGMRELGVNLAAETDAIFVSHYHPSARFDLHTLLNELGGYCPGRSDKGCVAPEKRVPLFCSAALSKGRNEHPPALIPSDLRVAEPLIATPGRCWHLARTPNGPVAVEEAHPDAQPKPGSLLLRTLPAFHNEACPSGQLEDADGMQGTTLSAIFVQSPDYGVLFTGDTEYRQWSPQILESLQGRVTVLVANMKTLAYLPRKQLTTNRGSDSASDRWSDLPLTQNQLGFSGTVQLARDIKPRVLVLRALGLECAVAADPTTKILRYAPEQLAIIHSAMHEVLKDEVEQVIIPGRHEVVLRKSNREVGKPLDGPKLAVDPQAIIPAFPKMGVARFGREGHLFVTQNQALAREIRGHIELLRSADGKDGDDTKAPSKKQKDDKPTIKPFLVIEGESGGGKTLLADAIASELSKGKERKKYVR